MGQASYVLLLIAMTIVMAAALVVFAITFDTYVIKSDYTFSNLNLNDAMSNIVDGNVLDTITAEFQRLV